MSGLRFGEGGGNRAVETAQDGAMIRPVGPPAYRADGDDAGLIASMVVVHGSQDGTC